MKWFVYFLMFTVIACKSYGQQKSKFLISEKEFVSSYISKKYKQGYSNQVVYPDSALFYFNKISKITDEYNNAYLSLKFLNQKQIVEWVLPMLRKYGFNDDISGDIDYQFLSFQKIAHSYFSFIVRLGEAKSSNGDLFLINTNKQGKLIDGLLIYRDIVGIHIDNKEYPILECNSREDGPPPYIQSVNRRSHLFNDSTLIYENCKILKKGYELLPKSEQETTVLLKSVYVIDSIGVFRATIVNKKQK